MVNELQLSYEQTSESLRKAADDLGIGANEKYNASGTGLKSVRGGDEFYRKYITGEDTSHSVYGCRVDPAELHRTLQFIVSSCPETAVGRIIQRRVTTGLKPEAKSKATVISMAVLLRRNTLWELWDDYISESAEVHNISPEEQRASKERKSVPWHIGQKLFFELVNYVCDSDEASTCVSYYFQDVMVSLAILREVALRVTVLWNETGMSEVAGAEDMLASQSEHVNFLDLLRGGAVALVDKSREFVRHGLWGHLNVSVNSHQCDGNVFHCGRRGLSGGSCTEPLNRITVAGDGGSEDDEL
jgi:hypothetical protein